MCRIRKLTNSSPSENPYALRGWATNCGPHASPHLALAHALALALVGSGAHSMWSENCASAPSSMRLHSEITLDRKAHQASHLRHNTYCLS